MPVYEFTCNECRKDFEILCPMDTQVQDVKCPSCNQEQLSRKVSLFGFVSSGEISDNSCYGGECGMGSGEPSSGCGGCGPSGCGCH